tara:strand:+ start:769 stop:1500 length:732 start_codon:yes stop_codon:yes gene_type:complete
MDIVNYMFFGIIVIIIIVIIYFVIKQKNKGKKKTIYKQYFGSPADIMYASPIDETYLQKSVDSQCFTLGLCVYIKNWYYNYNSWKLLGYQGPEVDIDGEEELYSIKNKLCAEPSTAFSQIDKTLPVWKQIKVQTPGLWFYPKVNNLLVVMNTESIIVENIPVGSWFHLFITATNSTLEVYIDGTLYKTYILKNPVQLTKNNFYFGSQFGTEGTFSGLIQNFEYADYVYSNNQIYSRTKYFKDI